MQSNNMWYKKLAAFFFFSNRNKIIRTFIGKKYTNMSSITLFRNYVHSCWEIFVSDSVYLKNVHFLKLHFVVLSGTISGIVKQIYILFTIINKGIQKLYKKYDHFKKTKIAYI